MVSVFDERVIEERPWYVAYEEGSEIPADPTAQPQAEPEQTEEESVSKPKRKNWKDAVAEKAQELEGDAPVENAEAQANPEPDSAS